jgi:ribose/xylose/arabinose/galactoside ABC-type transport system permease subunit
VLEHAAGVWSATSRYAAVLVLLAGIFVYFSVTQDRFLTGANIENLLTSVSILWVVSIGMTFVVLTGGIDLSVGSLLALTGLIISQLFNDAGLPAWLAVVLAVLAGAVIGGGVNGVLIGRFGLSFFVVTLGTLVLYRGIDNLWSDTKTTYVVDPFIDGIGFGELLGVATPIWIMLATFVVAFVVLRWTYFGRDVYAVGGNIEAARLSGINAARTLILVYAIAGLCAALGGAIQTGRLGAASPLVGEDIPLQARRDELPRRRRRRRRDGGRRPLHRDAPERPLDRRRLELLAAGRDRRDPDRGRRDRPHPAEPERPLRPAARRRRPRAHLDRRAETRGRVRRCSGSRPPSGRFPRSSSAAPWTTARARS